MLSRRTRGEHRSPDRLSDLASHSKPSTICSPGSFSTAIVSQHLQYNTDSSSRRFVCAIESARRRVFIPQPSSKLRQRNSQLLVLSCGGLVVDAVVYCQHLTCNTTVKAVVMLYHRRDGYA